MSILDCYQPVRNILTYNASWAHGCSLMYDAVLFHESGQLKWLTGAAGFIVCYAIISCRKRTAAVYYGT